MLCTLSNAQMRLSPDNNEVDASLIKDEVYEMRWSVKSGDTSNDIGKVITKIKNNGDKVLITSEVKRYNSAKRWVDTTIVTKADLKPIYHASYNENRDMVINYGAKTEGFYKDKTKREKITLNGEYPTSFDSSMYPQVIRWLPLNDNYTADLLVFNFNPSGKTDVLNAYVKEVSSTSYNNKDVWDVVVTDDIVGGNVKTHYYISKEDRSVLRMEVNMGAQSMIMERI
ncbi:hypothetical protein Y10_06940 [Neptunitalea sp. Y10]|uniref:Uncharacterized protein n=2 Tax=Neptunitalea lumnitzerae TaxID=2965509 RepID=A0ABQ5MG88_9FLAO|nr:hypothetical protein Y10_06940 [Neptunitalea sp. Y10]